MSIESDLVRLVTVTVLGLNAACAGIQPVFSSTSTREPTPSATPSPTLSPQDVQMTRVAPLTTPGAVETAVLATSEAFVDGGWQTLVDRGFPLIAINSVVEVEIVTNSAFLEGSGNLMHIEGYSVLLTAGHVLENKYTGKIFQILLKRDSSLPNSGYVIFSPEEFGIATATNSQVDFGVVVFPDKVLDLKKKSMLNPDLMLRKDQLYFGKTLPDKSYDSICFPGVTYGKPYISVDAGFPDFVEQPSGSEIILNNNLALGGCSGGGQFVRDGDSFLYIGPSVGRWGPDRPLFADVMDVSAINSLGVDGFNDLLASAIENYNSKNYNSKK